MRSRYVCIMGRGGEVWDEEQVYVHHGEGVGRCGMRSRYVCTIGKGWGWSMKNLH